MAAVAQQIVIRESEPTTLDRAAVAAIDGDGWIAGALELAARSVWRAVADALRHTRPVSDERRRDLPYLTWPTTPLSS